jgi:hypothetical protein
MFTTPAGRYRPSVNVPPDTSAFMDVCTRIIAYATEVYACRRKQREKVQSIVRQSRRDAERGSKTVSELARELAEILRSGYTELWSFGKCSRTLDLLAPWLPRE